MQIEIFVFLLIICVMLGAFLIGLIISVMKDESSQKPNVNPPPQPLYRRGVSQSAKRGRGSSGRDRDESSVHNPVFGGLGIFDDGNHSSSSSSESSSSSWFGGGGESGGGGSSGSWDSGSSSDSGGGSDGGGGGGGD